MAEASRDQNRVTTLIASYNGVTLPAKVEHATGYLKMAFAYDTLDVPVFNEDIAPRDQNHKPAALAAYYD